MSNQLVKGYPVNEEKVNSIPKNDISVAFDKDFPYNARELYKAIGRAGDFTTNFNYDLKRFQWDDRDYMLLTYQEHIDRARGAKTRIVHNYYLSEEAALDVAGASRTKVALQVQRDIRKKLREARQALKEIKELGFEKVYGKEVRRNFTDTLKNVKPDAAPTDYIQITYATKAYSGIACNRKKEDFSLQELRRNNAVETLSALKFGELVNPSSEDILNCVKQSAEVVNNVAPVTNPDLFYDKSYPSRDSTRGKIVELVSIVATLKKVKQESIWLKVYQKIQEHFGIDIVMLWERSRRKEPTLNKIDVIINYGAVTLEDGDMMDLGDWVLDYMTKLYTQHYNPQTLIAYDSTAIEHY